MCIRDRYISAPISASAAAQPAATAAQITEQICNTEFHAQIAAARPRISIHALPLLIPGTAALQALQQHLVLHILRLQPYGFLRMFQCSDIAAHPRICRCAVKIPQGAPVMDPVQDMERLFISAGLQVIGRRLQVYICLAVSPRTLFLPAVGAIAPKTAKAAETSISAISPIASGIQMCIRDSIRSGFSWDLRSTLRSSSLYRARDLFSRYPS